MRCIIHTVTGEVVTSSRVEGGAAEAKRLLINTLREGPNEGASIDMATEDGFVVFPARSILYVEVREEAP